MIFEPKTVTQIKGIFHVPAYQRGYRWTKLEVERLLNDIGRRKNRDKPYCIQPIVVLPKGEGQYELVDGQQRLTTLFLVLSVLKLPEYKPGITINFSIDYDTRPESTRYLQLIEKGQENQIEKDKRLTIDCWHIYNAYQTIKNWLGTAPDKMLEADDLYRDLAKYVKVLWYETDDKDGHALFERLNIGRIPLTNAELIKALFLNRETMKNNPELKQNEIATQWDSMEQELRKDEFWAFINRENSQKDDSRLDFILKLMAADAKPDDPYGAFFYFNEQIGKRIKAGGSPQDVWDDIRRFYLRVREWYDDRTLYNYAGFLISEDPSVSIKSLMDETSKDGKEKRISVLEDKIAALVKLPGKTELAALQYGKNDGLIRKILLCFNVLTMEKNGERFPYERYKNPASGWSLEHIHARNSQELRTKEEWKDWLDMNIQALENAPKKDAAERKEVDSLVAEAKDALANQLNREIFIGLAEKITEKLSDKSADEAPDSIVNLALLQTDDNAALSNSTFNAKRGKIIEKDRAGHFISVCTRNVFMKYYSPTDKTIPWIWGQEDKKAYLDEIARVVYSAPNKAATENNGGM